MSGPWRNEEEEEEEEELDESNYNSDKDAVIFAIDVSKTMLTQPLPNDSKIQDSPTEAAIKCAYQIMQQRIISNPKDMMGVLLFGTEQSKFQEHAANSRGGLQYPHCYLLNDLDIPGAEDVKALRALVDEDEEARKLLIPSAEPVAMSNLLFCAIQIFTTKAPNFGSRRLFIITDNDDPHAGDKNARSQAAVRAKDLYDLGVIIELFAISQPNQEFDRTKFYDDIIYRDPSETEGMAPMDFKSEGANGISLLTSLISDINSKQVAKRSLFSNLPFEIGPGFKISVKGYNIIQKQTPARSCFIYLGDEESKIATAVTIKVAGESDGTVDKDAIKRAYKFGGDTISFGSDEQKELKSFGPPVLRIIGFKPQSMLPFWASMNKSTFIYPSEEDYVGSTRVFAALWQKLLKDEKIGLAWYIARSNAVPVLVAILPSNEKLDDHGKQLLPQGLWLSQLPTADDIREPPQGPTPIAAPDDLINEMRKIIQQLQLPKAIYDPIKYPNPSLQWHYRIVQALALEEELPEKPEDKTIPKHKQIEKRAGEFIHNWGELLAQAALDHNTEGRSLKREADDDEGPSKKKVKGSVKSLVDMSTSDLKSAVVNETLAKFTVADLKEFCQRKGLASSGKKVDLVERIEGYVENS